MGALFSLLFGMAAYVFFLCTFAYAIGFVGNVFVPKGIDSGAPAPLVEAIASNVLVLGIFAVQHSVMARRAFKRWWTQVVPPAIERSTYVLAATLALALLLWQWRPIAEPVIWRVENPVAADAIWARLLARLGVLLLAHLPHQPLRAVRPASGVLAPERPRNPRGGVPHAVPLPLRAPPDLSRLRPRLLGRPVMTAGHLMFATGATGYILVGIWFEERDLVHQFGEIYRRYREQVGMLLPSRKV